MAVRTVDVLTRVLVEAGYEVDGVYSDVTEGTVICVLPGGSRDWVRGDVINLVKRSPDTISLIVPPLTQSQLGDYAHELESLGASARLDVIDGRSWYCELIFPDTIGS